jgi:BirA family biotin operon repressor/biotin-[acetyl-CoA-carboxylase] ligase
MRVTSAVAVAVCRAIERLVVVKAGIKWVNDILIDGKKVCGILTEGISGFESGRIESVVVGIGVNVRTPQESFPEDVRPIAASLLDGKPSDPLSRNQLAAAIVDEVLTIMAQLESMAFLEEYRRRSVVLGANVLVVQGPHSYEAVVERIDDDGSLVVRASDTVVHTLNSGEISLRPLSGGHW